MLLLLKHKNVQSILEGLLKMKKVLCLVTLLTTSALAMEKKSPKIPVVLIFPNGTIKPIIWNPNAIMDHTKWICFAVDVHVCNRISPMGRVVPSFHPHVSRLKNRNLMTISDAKAKLVRDGIVPQNTPLYIRHKELVGNRIIKKFETAPDTTRLCDIEARYGYVHLSPFVFNKPATFR